MVCGCELDVGMWARASHRQEFFFRGGEADRLRQVLMKLSRFRGVALRGGAGPAARILTRDVKRVAHAVLVRTFRKSCEQGFELSCKQGFARDPPCRATLIHPHLQALADSGFTYPLNKGVSSTSGSALH